MEKASKGKDSRHLGFLDGLRGGAALWVLLAHCMIWGGWRGIALPSPKIAVDIFIVLSGFLMVYQFRQHEDVESVEDIRTAMRFWLRRFFRIAPVYYLVLLFIFIFWHQIQAGYIVLRTSNPAQWAGDSLRDPARYHMTCMNLLVHVSFLFGLLPQYASSNLSPDWSIGLEMQFYAVFPFLYFALRRYSWVVVPIIAVVLRLASTWFLGGDSGVETIFPDPSFLFLKLPVFAIGMLSAEVFCSKKNEMNKALLIAIAAMAMASRHGVYIICVVGLILYFAWRRHFDRSSQNSRFHRFVHNILSNSVAEFMANTSYSVYLVHGLFLSLVGGWLFRQPRFLAFAPGTRVAILILVVSTCSYLLGWFVYRGVEVPFIELGRKLSRYFIGSPRTVALTPAPIVQRSEVQRAG